MRRYRLAVLGGTFDHLHVGHHALLASAFRVGEEVAVGLTTDRFVADHPKPVPDRIQPFSVRRAALVRWVHRNFPGRRWRVTPLEDPFGRSVGPEVDVLVVSRDTEPGGRSVNRERRRLGRRPVPLVVVPLALADDLEPVSSRRVRSGEIATDGRRLAPIRVRVSTSGPKERAAAVRAVRTVFPRARVVRNGSLPGRRRLGGLSGKGRPPPAPPAAVDLSVELRPWKRPGWVVVETTPRVRLRPRLIRGSRLAELEAGLVEALRPRPKRKFFGTPRSSHG